MCSSRGLCDGNNRSNRSSGSGGSGSGAHYALCALGLGLIALGIVMIVWTVVPMDGESGGSTVTPADNSSAPMDNDADETEPGKSSTIAMVLVAVGAILLLLSICLGVRNKRRGNTRGNQTTAAAVLLASGLPGQPEEQAVDSAAFSVPSYDEVVGSDEFPVRQSNLRQSTSQLPSYEDILAAVENEGAEPADNPAENSRPAADASAPAQTSAEPPAQTSAEPPAPGPTANPNVPARSSSRASRLLRPLRVRRIKSDKLHLKDFRLQIRSPTQNPVTIEPITPPPQYDNKTPEFE